MADELITYRYVPGSLSDHADEIMTTQQKIEVELEELEAFVATTFEADWCDDAHGSYVSHKLQWDTAMNDMNSILRTDAAPALREMEHQMAMTECDLAKLWQH